MDESPKKQGILYALLHRMKPHHHHMNFLLIAMIVLVIILVILVKPALLGFKISKQFEEIGVEASDFIRQADKTKGDLRIAETQLESCKGLNEDYLQDTADEKDKTFACEQKNQELTFDLTRVETEFEQKQQTIQAELTSLQSQYSELKSTHNTVLENSANNICCKAKVDNKDIDSYLISNGKIVCTIGEGESINC